jgi:hypothetical protein
MSKKSDLLKSIVKGQVAESPTLDRFLKSRGLNPKTVTKDQKVAHSKMGQFKKWQRDHATDLTRVVEGTDKKDTITFDIPLLIRVLELTREDIKSDVDLHRVVERLIQIRNKGVLTMADYRMIATLPNIRTKHVNENHVAIAMGNMLDDEGSMVLNQIEELERGCAMIRSYIGKDYEKQLPAWVQSKVTLATDYMSTVGNYLSSKSEKVKEEVEFQEASHDPWKDKHFGPTKIIKQKYHVKTDTKSFNVKADNEDHAHKLVTKHAPGSKIVSIEHKGRIMEEQIDENADEITARHQLHHTQMMAAMKAGDKVKQQYHSNELNKAKQDWAVYHANQPKKQPDAIAQDYANREKMYGPGKVRDSVEIEGTPIQEGSAALRLAQALRKEREARELKDKSREAAERNEKAKQPVQQQEAALEDPQSATQAPYDCANNPDDTVPKGKKLIQMSKSARIIKSIYKRKGMKEEIYDTEKEGKSIATYGKKPKLSDNEKKIEAVGGKPQAAAIMTGGTTLTGTPRDTVEIDPMMKPPKPGSLGQSDKPKNNNR